MRWRRNRLLRRFPEFERLSDEEAQRFLRAARRSISLRGNLLAIPGVLLFWLLFFCAAERLVTATEILDRRLIGCSVRPLAQVLRLVMLTAFAGGAALMIGWFGDWVVRRRLRYLLTHRTSCPECRYPLSGVPADDTGTIVCPECGLRYPASGSNTGAVDPD